MPAACASPKSVDGGWVTHQWIKKAVLLYFRTHDNQVMPAAGSDAWFDKVPLRFDGYTDAQFRDGRLPRRAAGHGRARAPSSAATWS